MTVVKKLSRRLPPLKGTRMTTVHMPTAHIPAWIGLLGAPTDVGHVDCGAAHGPQALRDAGLIETLRAANVAVTDRGDAAGPAYDGGRGDAGLRALDATIGWATSVRDGCAAILDEGGFPVMLGGDHGMALGSLAASAAHAARLGVPLHAFWFDAHPDFNTPETSPSGNTHGMPAAVACGYGHDAMKQVGAFSPLMDARNLVQFGIRDVDAGERENLRRAGVTLHDMDDLRRDGLTALVARAAEDVARRGGLIHVSFDIDAIDPAMAPGVGTPVPDGIAATDAVEALRVLFATGRVLALDVVEYAATRDVDGQTGKVAIDLLTAALGSLSALRHPAARVA